MSRYLIRAFYKFFDFSDYAEWRQPLLDFCKERGMKGTVLLGSEGLNSTISGTPEAIHQLFEYFAKDPRLADIVYKDSWADFLPFNRMLIKLKNEIVTFQQPDANPLKQVGTYIKPKEWNKLITQPDVVLIDTRNDYEVQLGAFKGAINPKTHTFIEFAEFVQKNYNPEIQPKLATYCTGGIRCEKATAYLKNLGYQNVYHLEGGILQYLEDIPEEESLFEGECFVFDKRVTVNHRLEKGSYEICYACQHPLVKEDLASPHYKQGVHCPYCHETLDEERQKAFSQRQSQM